MSITEFFHDAPVLATLLALAYAFIWGVFIYLLVKMYRK